MRTFVVAVTAPARRDLLDIPDWIARVESPTIAFAYVERIETFCRGLETVPHRGTLLADGMRKIGFEARCTILFAVRRDRVRILRVLYAGRTAEGPSS